MSELELFQQALQNRSQDTFFVLEDKKISYDSFWRYVGQTSAWLKTQELTENSLVLIDIENPLSFLVFSFACFNQKIIPAFLNSYFKDSQIDSLLANNTYKKAFTDKQKFFSVPTTNFQLEQVLGFSENPSQIALNSKMIFYTSGSVESKACVLTLKNFFYNALGSKEVIPFEKENVWGASLPLFHVGGFSIFVRAILSGASAYWIQKNISLTEQIQKNSLTHLSLVSTQFIRLNHELISSPQELISLKYLLLGGSAMAANHLEDGRKLNLPILKSYGMTEMGSQIYTNQILPYRELKIEGQEILIRGQCLFSGYLKNDKLNLPLDRDGWFHTGDLGQWNGDELVVLGRKDRIFQSGGENISPEFIEKELLRVPGIEKAYVLPEPDGQYGMRAVAYVETNLDLANLEEALKHYFSGLMRPKKYLPWVDLPKKSWKL